MKISQNNEFKPVTIIVETELELAELYIVLNSTGNNNKIICTKIASYLYDKGIMTDAVAKEILK